MKKLIPILMLFASTTFAQSPQAFTYQAVVRDISGDLITNQQVGLRISIRQTTQNGAIVYQESFAPTSNQHGLTTVEIGNGTVLNGVFANIDWATGPYFLETALDPIGGGNYTVLGASQLLSVPYALYAETSGGGGGGANTLDQAYDQGGAGLGRNITVDAGEVQISTATPSGIALRTVNSNSGVALKAESSNPANTFSTIQAETNSASTNAAAIIGSTTGAAWAVSGQAEATSTAQSAIYGSNLRTSGGHGVQGIGFNGVVGETNYSAGNAVFGNNADQFPPLGNGIGVAGSGFWGVVGEDRYLGQQAGAYGVLANGELGATGLKSFIIDHPADPENKFLKHFSTESNEVLNIYRGNVVFDANGQAVVVMPDYFHSINKDPSYQLTPIGAWAQLYVKEELVNGKFVIAGGQPGGKASWTVQAQRNDPYLQQFPEKRAVEVEKREGQKGKYFIPQLYGGSPDQKLIDNKGGEKQVPMRMVR